MFSSATRPVLLPETSPSRTRKPEAASEEAVFGSFHAGLPNGISMVNTVIGYQEIIAPLIALYIHPRSPINIEKIPVEVSSFLIQYYEIRLENKRVLEGDKHVVR